jgi:hypothetical protein
MRELKHIDVLSMAKIAAVLYAIIGFIMGLFITLGFAAAGSALSAIPATGGMSYVSIYPLIALFGIAAIIIMPIIAAIGGFIVGAISAFLYNVAAKYVGGVKLDL